jgi:sporulation protein YlmC with PRC-barrel domain
LAKKIGERIGALTKIDINLAKNCIIKLVFLEKREFFHLKSSEIAEISDHNINPSNAFLQ